MYRLAIRNNNKKKQVFPYVKIMTIIVGAMMISFTATNRIISLSREETKPRSLRTSGKSAGVPNCYKRSIQGNR